MALVISDIAAHVVPANLVLVYKDSLDQVIKGKLSNNTIVEVDADDMLRLGLVEGDLPCYAYADDYTAAHGKANLQNLEMRSALQNRAATEFTKMVGDSKLSKAVFVTEKVQLQAEIDEVRQSVTGDAAAIAADLAQEIEDRAAADTAIENKIGGSYTSESTVADDIQSVKDSVDDLSDAVAATSGSNAIEVTGEGATKAIGLKINANDRFLSQDSNGLTMALDLVKITDAATINNANVATRYEFRDAAGNKVGSEIDVLKDRFLKSLTFVEGAGNGDDILRMVCVLADGTESTTDIPLSGLFNEYTAANGIALNNFVFSGVVDATSGKVTTAEGVEADVLTVGANGFKVANIQAAITYAVGVETAAREAAELAITGRLDVIEGSGTGSIAKAAADAQAAAEATASADATSKANAAQAAAEATASADATAKANAAQAAAEATASADATTKANAAQAAAEATAAADAAAKANAAQAAAEATASAALTAHNTDVKHNAEVLFVRETSVVASMEYKQYICKAALTGTLPASPAEGTKRIVSVVAGGEGTVITAAAGDTIQGAASGIAINMANDTVTFIYDATAKDWVVL